MLEVEYLVLTYINSNPRTCPLTSGISKSGTIDVVGILYPSRRLLIIILFLFLGLVASYYRRSFEDLCRRVNSNTKKVANVHTSREGVSVRCHWKLRQNLFD